MGREGMGFEAKHFTQQKKASIRSKINFLAIDKAV